MKKLYVAGLTILLSAMFVIPAHAEQPPEIFISEINWAGSNLSTADEWLELFNPYGQSVDLGGWILTGSATSGQALALAEGTVIAANSTLLIANYNLGHEKTTLGVQPDLVTSALSLPNTDLDILLTTAGGIVVDEVHVSGRPDVGASEPFTSMERNFELDAWQSSTKSIGLLDLDQLGTPGFYNFVVASDNETDLTEETETNVTPPDGMCWCPCLITGGNTDTTDESLETTDSEIDLALGDSASNTEVPEENNEEINEDPTPMTFIHHALLINELVSDPEDGVEWVELFNPGINAISLEGWQLTDASGKATALQGSIVTGGYVAIDNPSGKLNNAGDTVQLSDPSNNKIDSVEYGNEIKAPKKGESLARDQQLVWQITTTITKNALNQINNPYETSSEAEEVDPNASDDDADNPSGVAKTISSSATGEEESSSLSSAREPFRVVAIAHAAEVEDTTPAKTTTTNSKTSSKLTLTGIITATPDTFGAQIAYIPGTQLYFYYADWPLLAVGDVVHVTGETSDSRGESRLKIASAKDIEIVSHSELEPTKILATNIENTPGGTLVRIDGSVVSRDGEELVVRDESGEITIIANSKTGMNWTSINSTEVSVVGIVRHLNGNSRLYPRTMADVEERILSQINDATFLSASITKQSNWKPWVGGTLLAAAMIAMSLWYFQYVRLKPLSAIN